jgi:hypothetical protein
VQHPSATFHWRARVAFATAWFVILAATFAATAPAAESIDASGNVSARLLYEPATVGTPVALEITRDGLLTRFDSLEQSESEPEWPYGVFAARPLTVRDVNGDDEPEVVAELYWGGAHCCTRSIIAAFDPSVSTYRLVTHDWGDATWRLRDLDGDGIVEFVSWDARWAYWGGSYTESPSPRQIWAWRNGTLVDVSAEHEDEMATDMVRHWSRFRSVSANGATGKGSLAGYAADAYVIGRQGAAWKRIYRAYQEPDRVRFFRALKAALTRLGYRRTGAYVPPMTRSRKPGRWRSCRGPVPEIGFIAALQMRGISCRLARRVATETAPGRGRGTTRTSSRFTCRHREVAIETIRVRCRRGLSEQVRFFTGL